MSFEFPKAIADLVYAQWTQASQSHTPGHQVAPCPSLAVLTDLMNNCFFASLRRDEERLTQFDLALCSPSDLPEAELGFSRFTKAFNLIRFTEPRKLSVNELARLSPACNPEKTLILATFNPSTHELTLWGMADLGWRPAIIPQRLLDLRVRVFGPGEMKVTLRGHACCTFKDGRMSIPEGGLISNGSIYDFFKQGSNVLCRETQALAGGTHNGASAREQNRCIMDYLSVLQEIIGRMQQLQHGGCILIVPEAWSSQNLPHATVKYRCRDDTVWNYLCGRVTLHDQFQREEVEASLRDTLDALVRLTAVDGAVLMTRKFEVLGFGTVVHLPQQVTYKVYRCHDRQASRATEIAVESYGTRHRSAFEFCYRCAPSVAIIASQDGDMKVVTRVGQQVFFWENALFECATAV